MSVAYRIHLRRHADIERRQLGGLIGGVTGAVLPGLGLGNTKTNNPNQPTQPPSQGKGNNTPPAANPGTTPTVANGVSTPTGGGGGNNSGGSNGGVSGGNNGGGSNGGVSGGNIGGVSGGSSNGGGGGGGGGGGTATSAGPATTAGSAASNRTSGTLNPSNTPSTGGTISNDGSSGTGSTPNSAGTVNVGSGSHGPVNEGLSDFTAGSRTSGDPSGSNPSTTGNTLGGGKTGTATGPIVAAVILSILLSIAVVVFILRRRSSKRRDELAIKWWFTRNPTSQSYGDDEALNPGTSSRRSSFATTLDHSKTFLADTAIPPPPPMAEIGRPIGTDPALILDINADQNRFSIGSANSHNSQFLVVHHRESLQHETSASLMSCTESFPFPKPPLSSSADRTLFQACEGSPKKQESEMPYIASPTIARSAMQYTLGDPFADNNPFEDSAHFPGRIETVRRPFIPHLHDELEVNIGDSVRIVQIFDDGWAFVEKISEGEQGLVPVNCLLDLMQNPLLEGKRMSSQGAKIT